MLQKGKTALCDITDGASYHQPVVGSALRDRLFLYSFFFFWGVALSKHTWKCHEGTFSAANCKHGAKQAACFSNSFFSKTTRERVREKECLSKKGELTVKFTKSQTFILISKLALTNKQVFHESRADFSNTCWETWAKFLKWGAMNLILREEKETKISRSWEVRLFEITGIVHHWISSM